MNEHRSRRGPDNQSVKASAPAGKSPLPIKPLFIAAKGKDESWEDFKTRIKGTIRDLR